MSYTKLYSTILDSSIWSSSDSTRLVWITMLAMATKNGIVHASIDGLARRANVSLDAARTAIDELSSPDENDKSGVRGGRRIVPMQGCWQLVNFEFYRETRSIDAVRKQQWRDRSPSKKVNVQDNAPSSSSSSSSNTSTIVDPPIAPVQAPVIVVDSKRGRFAPADLEPSQAQRVRCQELRIDVASELRDFKLHEFNRDYSDWPRRFAKWIEESRVRRETENAKKPKRQMKHSQPDCGLTGYEKAKWNQ